MNDDWIPVSFYKKTGIVKRLAFLLTKCKVFNLFLDSHSLSASTEGSVLTAHTENMHKLLVWRESKHGLDCEVKQGFKRKGVLMQ